MDVRIAAHSRRTTARSSAAVLHARIARIISLRGAELTKLNCSIGTDGPPRIRRGLGGGGNSGVSPEACAGGEGAHGHVRGEVLDDLLDRVHVEITERTRRRARRRRGEQRDLTPRLLGREGSSGDGEACREVDERVAGSGGLEMVLTVECANSSFVFPVGSMNFVRIWTKYVRF
jgi:hypothetical protein